ncbi:MAG TPA: hypothetical protein VGO14_02145 [Solirubrobacteraceae bacterium]|nr:hypothetical protein [Solirubrobacteraceae bacterium]
MAARPDIGPVDAASRASCDHDAKASGRLVLERGGIRREIVCECGEVLAVLGRQSYNLSRSSPGPRGRGPGRWRRSRALLNTVGRRRRDAGPEAGAARLVTRS